MLQGAFACLPQPQFQGMWYATESMCLLTPNQSFKTCGMLQGACACLPPTTVSIHVVCYREHVLAYPQPQFQYMWYATGSMCLLTLNHSFNTWGILQGACACIPPTTVSIHVICYREHVLAYPQPQFQYMWHATGSMCLLTPNHSFNTCGILQGACACIPPTTVSIHVICYREHVLAYPQPQFQYMWYATGSMCLLNPQTQFQYIWYTTESMCMLTPNQRFKTCGMLQGACACLPPTTVSIHVVCYREHVLAYPQPQFQYMWHTTGSMCLHIPNQFQDM